ncbi:J domain-containing protein [Fusobacterium periodonticum]|uniref:J domain-containing protein n=1 Tax=Fusobacterium periodonticum TaxID=860 RepID=UPI00195723D5|nr:J domain-containing protein [Fusobacterium periodonticum]VTX71523.1 Co-chaperone protein HscB [Fusobacterium periodonticum]
MDKKYLECLEILELKVGFTLDELKKKWLELSKKYHPDKHATADEILKKLAEDQYKRINEAYTYLKENYGQNQSQNSSEKKYNYQKKSRMETDPDFYLENCDILNEENIKIFLNRFPYEKNNILLEAFLALKNKNLNQLRNLSPRIENIVYNQSFEIIVNRLFPNFKNKKQSFFTNIKLLLNENSRNNMLIFLQKVKENLLKNDNYSFWGLNSENQDFKLLSNEYYFLLDNKLDSFIRESDSYLGEIFQFKEELKRKKSSEANNVTASNNFNKKSVYILFIILLVIAGLYFLFFKDKNENQEVSTQSTTSYSQPQPQQEEVKSTVVENNNVNNYIPTVEDARYVNYKTYYNDYYDYSIDYPDDEYFQISKTYEDGMKLQNDNGEVIISLTSNWNPNGESLQQAYDKAVREKPNAPYKFLGKTFFTITYEDNGLLVFRKTMYDKNTNKYVYLYVSFPPEYKDYMTPIVERMANSMKKSVSNVTSTANNSYSDSQLENKFGRVVKDKYVGGSFIEFLRNANENEYYYLRDQFWEILNTMYVTEDNKTYYYLNDIIDQLETKADWDNSSRVISLEVKGNKMYYTVGFPKGYNANTPSWVQFEIFERKFNDGIGLRTAHVSCAINGVEYKDWDAVYAIFR